MPWHTPLPQKRAFSPLPIPPPFSRQSLAEIPHSCVNHACRELSYQPTWEEWGNRRNVRLSSGHERQDIYYFTVRLPPRLKSLAVIPEPVNRTRMNSLFISTGAWLGLGLEDPEFRIH